MNPRVKDVVAEKNFKLKLTFTDGSSGVFDCRPYLQIGVFKELQDEDYFSQVSVLDGTIVWPHEQDFCPDTLYLESDKILNSKNR